MNTIRVDVVSAEESIFSGEARFVALPGEAGECDHLPEQAFYMVGGIEEAFEKAKTLQ